jgi:phosphatidate cytidylyltransferase
LSNNLQRILFAVVAIPIAIGIVYQGGLALAILVAVIAALGSHELVTIARRQGIEPLGWLAVGASALIPIGTWVSYGGSIVRLGTLDWEAALPSPWFALAALVIAVLTGTLLRRAPTERPLGVVAVSLLAPLYCAVLPSFLLGIRFAIGPARSWPATWAVFFPLAVTWICDTAAMYLGKLVGGPKLAPVVSPRKTRSGSIGGLFGGVAAAVIYNLVAMNPSGFTVSTAQALVFGVVLSVAAQVGDLAESLFKREVGVKDSSGLIPGHGGVLDRFDALYFVVPISAMLYRLFGVI